MVKEHSIFKVSTHAFWRNLTKPTNETLGRAILAILVFSESMVCMFWIYILSGLGGGYLVMAIAPYFYIVLSYIGLLIFYRVKKFKYFTFTQLVMLLVMPFFMQWVIGGYEASSSIAIWAILCPIGALMILGTKQSTNWFILFTVLSITSWMMNDRFADNSMSIPMHIKDTLFLMNIMGVTCILYGVMRYFQGQREYTMQALATEQVRSEKLLLNVLPKSIAKRLKDDDVRIADSHESVTILFADIVGFTKFSSCMTPVKLVALLSQLFSQFDLLVEKHGLEKIKTIGDGYMVAGGVPRKLSQHADVVTQLAIEMQTALSDFNQALGHALGIRIGISSGAVVAGVIGTAKFSYDLWGDPVNMASRMEQTALANSIQISEATYRLLAKDYAFKQRHKVSVKGKGELRTYILKF